MKQSGFLKQQEAIRQELVAAAERITRQLMLDAAQIVLHNEFGWGYERIKRFSDALAECYGHYHGALEKGPEQDVYQEHLDRGVEEVLRGRQKLIPFEERYPEIKKISY